MLISFSLDLTTNSGTRNSISYESLDQLQQVLQVVVHFLFFYFFHEQSDGLKKCENSGFVMGSGN